MNSGISQVRKIIDSIFPIHDQSFTKLIPHLQTEVFPKDQTFITLGRKNNNEYFLLNGIIKSYLYSPEGEEITISFYQDNSVLTPNSIRTKSGISNLYFKALSDCELMSVNAREFEALMIEDIEIRNFANTVLQTELIAKVDKEIGLASLTAKERLIAFRKNFRNLENLVPHTDIASYLGITNISLSRLRRERE